LENKIFQIDSNILSNKKKNNKSVNKSSAKKSKNQSKFFLFSIIFFVLVIGFIFFIKTFNDDLIKNFSDGEIIVCKDRLVSKDLFYIFNKKENAFINKKEGLFFSIYYCSNYDK
jgi:hypothetical protein